jgi:MoaA/NifB/PqqE/SkfB family radical SAM enzyme
MSIKQKTKSLQSRGSQLSDTFFQLNVLNGKEKSEVNFPKFKDKLNEFGFSTLSPSELNIFQINIGRLCNQSCAHCHVDASPERKAEVMTKATLQRCLDVLQHLPSVHTVDITGGAPEMNPHFRWFVQEVVKLGKKK